LNNVVKHARASEVWLRIVVRPLAFTLVIEDDGCGLSAAKLAGTTRKDRISSGHGLANMDKRLQTAGGRCVITDRPDQGTRVELEVDLTAPRSPEVVTGGNGASHRT
jgi:signal transduction histidine kinase